nr:hypothetical protein [uncultured Rhodoferax sp.]
MLRWLDKLPLTWLALVAGWLAVAPLFPEPHLVEKIRMLSQGTLVRAIDIFDLLMHALPLLLLFIKLYRLAVQKLPSV